jgi:acyl carrier protein
MSVMSMMSIEEALAAHIEKDLITGPKIKLELDTSLVGIVDSSGVLELAMWIESTYDFSVDFEDITAEDFGTVRRLADWIRRSSKTGGA